MSKGTEIIGTRDPSQVLHLYQYVLSVWSWEIVSVVWDGLP